MSSWQEQLADDLHRRRGSDLLRALKPHAKSARFISRPGGIGVAGGERLLNFASNDYLALATHRHLIEASQKAAGELGVGSGASRLVTGHLEIHEAVEKAFAEFKCAEAGLIFPTGYMANLGVITALADSNTTLFLDKLNHASLIDAARAAGGAGAKVRVYPHLDLGKLDRLLERTGDDQRKIIVTDTVFSMDGDLADLPALCDLRDAHGAILVVDEAHATGVLGASGAGVAELQGVSGRIDVAVSTASKALGSLGGIVTGSQLVIDTLVNTARSFMYTTGVGPVQAAVIGAALEVVRDEPERRVRLAELGVMLREGLRANGWDVSDDPTPIVPLVVGTEGAALAKSQELEKAGLLCPAIRPPTVAPNSSRLRITLRADLEDGDVGKLVEVIGRTPE